MDDSRPTARRWPALVGLFVLALTLRLAWLATVYTPDLMAFQSGDYNLYIIGAQDFAAMGNFTNSLFLVRPPAFSLMIVLLGLDSVRVLVANAVLGALPAPLTVVLVWALLGVSRRVDAVALLAGLIMALDPASVVYSSFLGPEPLANLALLLSLITLWQAAARAERPVVRMALGALAGLLLGLSALARPAAYLLWLPLAGWLLVANRKAPRRWDAALAYAAASGLVIAAWTAHNGQVFKHATFSTIGPYTMVYYHAASVEHLATGQSPDEVFTELNRRVEARLNRPTPIPIDAQTQHAYLAATPEVASALNAVALEVFLAHPLHTLATIPIGLARMFGQTQVFRGALAHLDIAWNVALVLLTLLGLWRAARRRQWALFWLALLTGLYFVGGTLVVKTAGLDTRERSMLTPLMAACAAYALVGWRKPSPPALLPHGEGAGG
ncbi:MAG: hypothetical protein IT323_16175 [Anaerolineae bacterium]|nr:hypothetical protein [Anaerolineae bacterium]